MIALLVHIIRTRQPVFIECVLHATGDVNGIRRFVRRANQIPRGPGAANQAACADERIRAWASGKGAGSSSEVCVVDALECGCPSVLRKVVVINAEAGADDSLFAVAGRVSDPKARRDLLAVILRKAGHDRNLQRTQCDVRGIVGLASARTRE